MWHNKKGRYRKWMDEYFHINLHRHSQQRPILLFTMHTNHMLEFFICHKIKTKNTQEKKVYHILEYICRIKGINRGSPYSLDSLF